MNLKDIKNIATHIDWQSFAAAGIAIVPYIVPGVQYLWSWVRPRQNNDQGNHFQAQVQALAQQHQDPEQERQMADRVYNDNRITNNNTYESGANKFESGAITNNFYVSSTDTSRLISNAAMI